MSTFDGIIREFPGIRFDFFRGLVDQPALASFLSHIHSDHLAGLDTLKSSFVYCSAATREILLRLERYPCRINYAQGILEARQQTYRHLAKLLKPLPLDTPTQIELRPHEHIQVTLIDANHCVGAVMFLIESEHAAVLYTGDIRAEPWWVNSIARNPCLVEYTAGLKTLNRIYLDTSILDNIPLQTKAEGLRELLSQVARYPPDTIFYIQAWTYGYEEVWTALSKALNSKIHVDDYKMQIYKSLVRKDSSGKFANQTYLSKEAPSLVGFTCGNNQQPGCLTLDPHVRIHSCEKGTPCVVMQHKPVVWIRPIVAHLSNGHDLLEIGIGGGAGDLNKEVELQTLSAGDVAHMIGLAADEFNIPEALQEDFASILKKSEGSSRNVAIDMDISSFTEGMHITMKDALEAIISKMKDTRKPPSLSRPPPGPATDEHEHPAKPAKLPERISFPYARHSSLPELRLLVEAFRPDDVWPCTVDTREWRTRGITMHGLFGDLCSGRLAVFEHDQLMNDRLDLQYHEDSDSHVRDDESVQGQRSHLSAPSQLSHTASSPPARNLAPGSSSPCSPLASGARNEEMSQELGHSPRPNRKRQRLETGPDDEAAENTLRSRAFDATKDSRSNTNKIYHETPTCHVQSNDQAQSTMGLTGTGSSDDHSTQHSPQASTSDIGIAYEPPAVGTRLRAFRAAEACVFGDATWDGAASGLGLISTTDHHSTVDVELGTR